MDGLGLIAPRRRRRPAAPRDAAGQNLSTPDYVSQYQQQPLQWHYTPGVAIDESDTIASFPGQLDVANVLGSDGTTLPPPGMIGEGLYFSRINADALSLTSGGPTNILRCDIPPGDWDIWGVIILEMRQIPTSVTHWMACLTPVGEAVYYPDQTTSAASGGPGSLALASSFPMAFGLIPVIATTTVTLPYYLNVLAVFTGGSAWAYGNIFARRRR